MNDKSNMESMNDKSNMESMNDKSNMESMNDVNLYYSAWGDDLMPATHWFYSSPDTWVARYAPNLELSLNDWFEGSNVSPRYQPIEQLPIGRICWIDANGYDHTQVLVRKSL